ncbi:MAG TPA: ABC transporter substrate-binding protein [Herbaspirillum sp.]|jgi:NitT/TauT family transport system substrate-binding protein
MASVSRFAVGLISLALAAQASFAQELTWKHGTVAPKGDAGFLYMGAEKSIQKLAGVDITMVSLKGDALLTKALLAGEIDSYEGNPGGPMIAASKGADIKILGCPWPGLPYALYTKDDVKSMKDLKGKAIAVSDPGALPDLFARAALRSAGLDPNKDVQYVRSGSDADRVKALAVGVVAAAPSSIEFAPKAKELGLKMLVQAKDVTPDYLRTCIITTSKVLSTKRAAAVAFMAAQMTGLSYALEHENETIALSNKITSAKPDDLSAKEIFREAKSANMVDPTLAVDPKKFIYLRDLLADGGLLSRTFDPSTILDPSVRADAAKKAGVK